MVIKTGVVIARRGQIDKPVKRTRDLAQGAAQQVLRREIDVVIHFLQKHPISLNPGLRQNCGTREGTAATASRKVPQILAADLDALPTMLGAVNGPTA